MLREQIAEALLKIENDCDTHGGCHYCQLQRPKESLQECLVRQQLQVIFPIVLAHLQAKGMGKMVDDKREVCPGWYGEDGVHHPAKYAKKFQPIHKEDLK